MPIDPTAAELCARIVRSGGGSFAGRTPLEVRHAGLALSGTWALADDEVAVVAHLHRTDGATTDEIATAMELPVDTTSDVLQRLRRGGFVRSRQLPDGSERWTAILTGRRHAHRDATGALAALLDDPVAEEPLLPEPGGIHDVEIGDDVHVRIYRPHTTAAGRSPVVVFVHGGAWVSGTLDGYDGICAALVEMTDALVVSVDYRLAPEHPFPVPLEDTRGALRWVVDHADDLEIDVDRLALMGDSAGGNLATVTAITAAHEGWCTPAVLVLLYPVLDATMSSPSVELHAFAPLFSKADMEWMYDHYGAPAGEWRASPLEATDDVLAHAPPTIVVCAEVDPVADDGARFAARLADIGVSSRWVGYEGMMHGFYVFAPTLESADRARELVATALVEHLHGRVDR